MKKFFLEIFYRIFSSKKKKIFLEKDEIKVSMLVLKNELSEEKRLFFADSVFKKIEQLPSFEKSEKILLYWSNHIDLPMYAYALKWSREKEILLPSIRGNKLRLKKFVSYEKRGKKDNEILNPITEPYHGNVDLAIIPGIAFDKDKYRMGQGKGYYNHFLKHKNIQIIGVGFDFQVIDDIPTYWRDIKMDMIVTPSNILV